MFEYAANNKTYIDLKDIREECKDYCKGTRSHKQLIERKTLQDYVYGQVIDNELIITEKHSRKFGSVFVNKEEVIELFNIPEEERVVEAPPLIEDKDLVFFKDDDGKEYYVPMRGARSKNEICFQVKGVMRAFEMPNLQSNIQLRHTSYEKGIHYMFFNMSESYSVTTDIKEMYLTYDGLMKVLNVSKSGIGHKFKNWIDEVVFAAAWGTQDQKVETFQKVLNVDADHLKCIMSKVPSNISCLYLIDIKQVHESKRVFKYGFTDNVHRRFKEHMRRYGNEIALDTFILIPVLDLSKAETEFKHSVSRYLLDREGENELIALCSEGYLNIKTIFRTISEKHTGNMAKQIAYYENEIKTLRHQLEMKDMELESKLALKDKEVELMAKDLVLKDKEIELKDKDLEILRLQLQLARS